MLAAQFGHHAPPYSEGAISGDELANRILKDQSISEEERKIAARLATKYVLHIGHNSDGDAIITPN